MHRDDACADNASGQRAAGPAEDGASDCARADRAAVFDADFLQARAGRDSAFAADAILEPGAPLVCGIKMESRAVGQNHGLRLQAHGAVAAEVASSKPKQLCRRFQRRRESEPGRPESRRTQRACGTCRRSRYGRREAIDQTNADDGAFAEGARRQRSRMHDVAIGIVRLRRADSERAAADVSGATCTMPSSVPSAGLPGSRHVAGGSSVGGAIARRNCVERPSSERCAGCACAGGCAACDGWEMAWLRAQVLAQEW